MVAVAAGFIDGLAWGDNSKAAIMRIGLLEMKRFCEEFFPGVKRETFTEESAGVADLITTCLGGRNRKCAEVRGHLSSSPLPWSNRRAADGERMLNQAFVTTGKAFDVLEREMLNGQKLQGIYTAKEINQFLKARSDFLASHPASCQAGS